MQSEMYSDIILDLYKNPKNFGELKNPDIKASGGNPVCGDEVTFEIKVENGRIKKIKFNGSGCAISKAAESMLSEMAEGKTLKDAKKISNKQVFEALGGVIQTRIKCALLGLAVLKRGMEQFEKNDGKKTVVSKIHI